MEPSEVADFVRWRRSLFREGSRVNWRVGRFERCGRLWRHENVNIPSTLKAKSEMDRRKPRSPVSGARQRIRYLGPKKSFHVRHGQVEQGTTIALDKGGQLLAIDLEQKMTRRLGPSVHFTREYEDIRNALQSKLPSPNFNIDQSRDILTEDWLDGQPLLSLPPKETISIKEVMTKQFLEHVPTGSLEVETGRYLDLLLSPLRERDIRDFLSSWVEEFGLIDRIPTSLISPSHGEPGSHNTVVANGRPFVVDWEPKSVGYRPEWMDLLSVLPRDISGISLLDLSVDSRTREAANDRISPLVECVASKEGRALMGALREVARTTTTVVSDRGLAIMHIDPRGPTIPWTGRLLAGRVRKLERRLEVYRGSASTRTR